MDYKELYYDTILDIAQRTKIPKGTSEFAEWILNEYPSENIQGQIMIALICGMLIGNNVLNR